MKKALLISLCLLFVILAGCGKQPMSPEASTDGTTEAQSETTVPFSEVIWDTGDFVYFKGDLPKGWIEMKDYGTSSYFEARYGESENAPKLCVSVYSYDLTINDKGADMTRDLVEIVKERESESASEIMQVKIGGLNFYQISFDSHITKETRCYDFYGQTVPDDEGKYKYVSIQMDNIKDDKQYDSLKGVLKQLEFEF